MAAAKLAKRKKPTRRAPPDVDAARERLRMGEVYRAAPDAVAFRVAGLEARVQAEARIANARLTRLEARVDRIASALSRLISREDPPASDGEDE